MKKIIKLFIYLFVILECCKLFFFLTANFQHRLIQDSEILFGNSVLYGRWDDGSVNSCDLNFCEEMPEVRVYKVTDDIVLRTAYDYLGLYYLDYLFFPNKHEIKTYEHSLDFNFQNRLYTEQYLSWQTVAIFLEKNNLNIIYFLNEDDPYIGILSMEEKYVPNELAWVKLNNDNLAGDFLKINEEKLNEFVTNNNLEMPYSIDELNEKISDSYSVIKNYEERLRVISILICVAKISLLFYILKHKKINLYLKQIFKRVNKCTSE